MSSPALRLAGVAKRFGGGARAVDGVDLAVAAGEIHALCGENGAGKTTLARIAAGVLQPDEGTVEAAGTVGLVHQHFELVDRLRVWENVVLGREPRRGLRLDRRAARERVRSLGAAYGLVVDPDAKVESLPVGVAQRVELLRELAREPAVLILDEPTAVLAPVEIDSLFATLHVLAERGTAIVVITHKLQEVATHADRVTVLRAGRVVARFEGATAVSDIARAMVGGDVPDLAERAPSAPRAGLALRDVHTGDGAHDVRGIDLAVGSGECVGVAGVEGNGQTALADAIAGVTAYRGTIDLAGATLAGGPRERAAAGVRVVPQDRLREALVPRWNLIANAILGDQQRPELRRGWGLDRAAAERFAREIVDRFDVRAPDVRAPVATLSGGNQQKLVVGRALAHAPRALVAYQPTRGIDVGAAVLVQSRLIEARNAGVAVLTISFELDELFALCDRIVVLYRGRIAGTFARDAFDRAAIGALMAGA